MTQSSWRQRVLTRVLERFYEELDEGGALLADTLGAGRDDSALEDLVLETYEKLQSHADPEHWLAENRTIWENRSGDFDERPTPPSCWRSSRRKGFHYMEALRRAGQSTVGGDLYKGYGEKFLLGQPQLRTLGGSTELGGRPRFSGWTGIPPAHHAEGNGGGPGGRETEGAVGERQNCRQKAGSHAGGQRYGGHGGPSDHGPCHDGPFEADGRDFSDAYRTEKLRMNCADFSDQEHLALRLLVERNGAPTELGRQVAGRYPGDPGG